MSNSRPMSVGEIADQASRFDWNPKIRFKHWVHAADSLIQEALVYLNEGNLAKAYLYLLRYSTLVLDHLPKHPEARDADARRLNRSLQKRIPQVVKQLEDLKPQLDRAYDEWCKMVAQREAVEARDGSRVTADHASTDAALSWNHLSRAKVLDAGENQELAVDLAKKEIRRRRRQGGLSEEEERRRRGAGFWDGWERNMHETNSREGREESDFQSQMEATRQRLDRSEEREASRSTAPALTSASYRYPTVNRSSAPEYEQAPLRPNKEIIEKEMTDARPARPPKELINRPFQRRPIPPPRPEKEVVDGGRDSSPSHGSKARKRITFKPAAYLENGEPIRPVFLSDSLRRMFMKMASDNTRRGVEMCGILCGTPVNNALFVSCLLIPEQRCTPDTCETENEGSMLEYCISHELLILGWIHTHPTQTCFMSSRDLHTQAGYQVMMPESIAIVCAPRHEPSHGIFRLTNPPGLPHILQCTHNDTFHQHSIGNIYTDATHPAGHVYESSSLDFDVVDLRPKP